MPTDFTFVFLADIHIGIDDGTGIVLSIPKAVSMLPTLYWPSGTVIGGQPIATPVGIAIGGDLTQSAGGEPFGETFGPQVLDLIPYLIELGRDKVFLGLGNHDIDGGFPKNWSRQMWNLIQIHHYGYKIGPDYPFVPALNGTAAIQTIFDTGHFALLDPLKKSQAHHRHGSMAYAWDWQDVHCIMLHRFGGDANPSPSLKDCAEKHDSFGWLYNHLQSLPSGTKILLFQHFGWDSYSTGDAWWTKEDRLRLEVLLQTANPDLTCLGIFQGHAHSTASPYQVPLFSPPFFVPYKDDYYDFDMDFKGRPQPISLWAFRPGATKGGSFAVARVIDDKIYVAYAYVTGCTWEGFGYRTSGAADGPALAASQNSLYMAWREAGGKEGKIVYSTFDGTNWSGGNSTRDDYVTKDTPAMASYNGKLYLAWREDDDLYFGTFDGQSWSDKAVAIKGAQNNPALAVSQGTLYLAWRGVGENGSRIFYSRLSGDYFTGKTVLPFDHSTNDGPALADYGGKLYVAWRGSGEGGLFYAAFDGIEWSDSQLRVSYFGTRNHPALAATNDKLYMLWRGSDDDYVWYSSFDGQFWAGQYRLTYPATGIPDYVGATTADGPAVAFFQNQLYAVWRNIENHSKDLYSAFMNPQIQVSLTAQGDYAAVALK